jgi:hypothetical protein
MNLPGSTPNPVRKHRREVWTRIYAPVALPFAGIVLLCIILLIAVAAGSMISTQITVLMSIVATAFIAFPMAILCLLPYVLFVLIAYGAGRAYAHARTPLRFVRRLTGQIADKTEQVAPKVSQPLIGLNVRLTRWENMLRGWQQPTLTAGKEKVDE